MRLASCFLFAASLLLAARGAAAQTAKLVLTTHYDSAQTQRRAVYGIELRGPRPDTVLQGPYRRYYRGGSLEELGHFAAGQADSTWTRYYPAGAGQVPTVARRLPMRAGQPDGAFVVFHHNGRVAQRGAFRRGQLVDSLMTNKPAGQPRLLARFGADTAGLRGSFRQWYGAFSAQTLKLEWYSSVGIGLRSADFYQTKDTTRYWTGQLAAGRLVGAYTEHDEDGEPRIRVLYTAQGKRRLETRYYTANWLRNEQEQYGNKLPADSSIRSQPAYSRQMSGPYLLEKFWDYSNGLASETPRARLLRSVELNGHLRLHTGDVVGARLRPLNPPPLPAELSTQLFNDQSPIECNYLYALYVANGNPKQPADAVNAGSSGHRNYPPLSFYRPPYGIEYVRGASRWLLGEADTTGGTPRPVRRRDTTLSNGQRLVETPRSTQLYFANGQLEMVYLKRLLGRELMRRYYAGGQREEVSRKGLLASYEYGWNDAGNVTLFKLTRVFGVKLVKVRKIRTRNGKREFIYKTRPRLWQQRKPIPHHR